MNPNEIIRRTADITHLDLRNEHASKTRPLQPRWTPEDPYRDGGNEDGTMVNRETFAIPNTQLTVYLMLSSPVDTVSMRNFLNITHKFFTDQLAASGDGQLPPSRNPFTYDMNQGLYMKATNHQPDQHFTWGYLNAIMGWLIPHLAPISKYRQEIGMMVTHADWGYVGYIGIKTGYTGSPLPEILPGPAGVYAYPEGG